MSDHLSPELNIDSLLANDVVVTWSGGPDSTGLIFLLLENFPCNVYPIFINRGQTNYIFEKESVEHYTNFFSKKYNKFHELMEVKIISPPNEFREFKDGSQYALRNSDLINQGVRYGLNKRVNTVLLATFENENQHGDGSKEYLSAKTIEIQKGTEKNDFITLSPFHFPTKFPIEKSVLFNQCNEKNFDLSFTRSCYRYEKIHCGDCDGCTNRYFAFSQTQTDPTEYKTTPRLPQSGRTEKLF